MNSQPVSYCIILQLKATDSHWIPPSVLKQLMFIPTYSASASFCLACSWVTIASTRLRPANQCQIIRTIQEVRLSFPAITFGRILTWISRVALRTFAHLNSNCDWTQRISHVFPNGHIDACFFDRSHIISTKVLYSSLFLWFASPITDRIGSTFPQLRQQSSMRSTIIMNSRFLKYHNCTHELYMSQNHFNEVIYNRRNSLHVFPVQVMCFDLYSYEILKNK